MNILTRGGRRVALCSVALFLSVGGVVVPEKTALAAPAIEKGGIVAKPGQRNEYVRTLQYLLKAKAFKVNTDGVYGAQTKSAVVSFQRSHHLIADGVVGGQTWKALVVPVKSGSKGYGVRALQNQLIAVGYGDGVTVDGRFGKQTVSAVKEFQRENEMKKDGIVGIATWRALLMEEGD